jgi:hypothetical protein
MFSFQNRFKLHSSELVWNATPLTQRKLSKSTNGNIFDRLAKLPIDKPSKFFLCRSIVRGWIGESMATLATATIKNIK